MVFPLLQNPTDICPVRQINVPGKYWIGHMSDEESIFLYTCSVRECHALHKWETGGIIDRDNQTSFSLIIRDNQNQTCLIITINDTSIGDLPLIITISDTCKNQPKRLDFDNTIKLSSLIVFSRSGQLSEVYVDTDTLADMVSIIVNKHAYKPSVKDINDIITWGSFFYGFETSVFGDEDCFKTGNHNLQSDMNDREPGLFTHSV